MDSVMPAYLFYTVYWFPSFISKCVFGFTLYKSFVALNILLESSLDFSVSSICFSILFVSSVLTRSSIFMINLFVFMRRLSFSFSFFEKCRCNLTFFGAQMIHWSFYWHDASALILFQVCCLLPLFLLQVIGPFLLDIFRGWLFLYLFVCFCFVLFTLIFVYKS